MKIVFCDMSMAQAQKFLRALDVVSGSRSAVELDFSFGYTALRALVKSSIYDLEEDGVYLVNSPAVLREIYKDIVEVDNLPSSRRFFVDLLYFLADDCILHSCDSLIVEGVVEDVDAEFAEQLLDNLNKGAREWL